MVREAWLARWLGGLERMYRWHHGTGVVAYPACWPTPGPSRRRLEESPCLAWQTLSPWSESWPVWAGWGLWLLPWQALPPPSPRPWLPIWRGLHGLLGVAVLVGPGIWFFRAVGADPGGFDSGCGLPGWRLVRVDFGSAARPLYNGCRRARVARYGWRSPHPWRRAWLPPGRQLSWWLSCAANTFGLRRIDPFTLSAVDLPGRLRIGVIKALGTVPATSRPLNLGSRSGCRYLWRLFDAAVAAPQFWIAGGIGHHAVPGRLAGGDARASPSACSIYRHDADAAFSGTNSASHRRPGTRFDAAAPGHRRWHSDFANGCLRPPIWSAR